MIISVLNPLVFYRDIVKTLWFGFMDIIFNFAYNSSFWSVIDQGILSKNFILIL